MAEQRQTFRFRLPWLPVSQPAPTPTPAPAVPQPSAPAPTRAPSAPQPALTPAASQPRTPVPAPTPAPAQRPPFRPAGVAQPTRAEPPPPSSRATPQTRVPPPSPPRPSPARQPSPQPQGPPKATPPSPPKPAPLPSQPTLKTPFPPKRGPTATDISQPPKEPMKSETLSPPPQESQQTKVTTPPSSPEKVGESSAQEKKLPETTKKLAKEAPTPKPATKQPPTRVHEPREMMPKGTYSDESKQQAAALDEVVIEKKEVLGPEKVTGASYRPPLTEEKKDTPKAVEKHGLPYSVIMLSGENKGASMHLSSSDSSSKREKPIPIYRGYKSNPYKSGAGAATDDGDEGRDGKSQDCTKVPEEEGEATETIYVNNNVQGINNSLVMNSSLNQRNPGVHLVLSRLKPVESEVKSGKAKQTIETRKAEVATTSTERLAYAPNIRRRCLQGLFLESSDSEPDNPNKPQRHGCRVGCHQKSKDGKIDVL